MIVERHATTECAYHTAGEVGFEAAMLLRCAGTGAGRGRARRRHSPSLRPADAYAEFSRPEAATRLVALLHSSDRQAWVDSRRAGGRHQYEVHRVVAPGSDPAGLDVHWRRGHEMLCGFRDRRLTPEQWMHRDRLAVAGWRAALLAAGRARLTPLGVRIADPDTAVLLTQAAWLLGVTVQMLPRPGGHLLVVDEDEPRDLLFSLAGVTAAPA